MDVQPTVLVKTEYNAQEKTVTLTVESGGKYGSTVVPLDQMFLQPTVVVLHKENTKVPPQVIKRLFKKQERQVAKATRGKKQPGSGNIEGYKSDVRVRGKWRIECKLTTKNSRRIELAELEKIRSECSAGEVPAFTVRYVDGQTRRTLEEWVMIPAKEFERFVQSS